MKSVDIIIIGGGLSGSATALGLMREGAGKVMLFDEQLPSQRWPVIGGPVASRGAQPDRPARGRWLPGRLLSVPAGN